MRIVGGRFRGRRLATPSSDRIRPTTDRTRESLFNILAHKIDLENKRAIDLFAGTGALGLEAISRGCSYCLFVEEGAEARGLIRTNIEAFALQGDTRIFKRDATRLGDIGQITPFDIALLDPPYSKGLGEKAISALCTGGWLAQDALIILEEARDAMPASSEFARIDRNLQEIDRREFGETSIVFLNHRQDA